MKKVLVISGWIITIIGIIQTSRCLAYYNELTEYGEEYACGTVIGSILLIICGASLLLVGIFVIGTKKSANKPNRNLHKIEKKAY
ncbi:MAG: hypothetical protein LBR45_05025 [Bacteroidales bacterium]|jgi:hypothetical protein|nr:hypothetical protein [Bacteroidales bacterium]